MKNATLYWIRLVNHTDINTQGYIGVSQDHIFRFTSHMSECKRGVHANPHLSHAYLKYGKAAFIVEAVYTGEESQCYIEEIKLRPTKDIGWNIAPGGHKSPGRTKGATMSRLSVERGQITRKLRQDRIDADQPTEDDLIFLDRKQEKKQLLVLKKEEQSRIKLLAKEEKKQKKIKEKQTKQEFIKRAKQIARTPGVRITEQPPRPVCSHCDFALAKPNGKSKYGFQKWHRYCIDCAKAIYNVRFKHLQHKKMTCEKCDFVPEDRCQMDLVFMDGNKNNKSKKNLQTLCANCARLHNKRTRTGKKSILNATVDGDTRIS